MIAPAATSATTRPFRGSSLILAIFVLSGIAGLVYEVVWARQLVLVFGNTTQAVSAILTGFFGGMAIGSVVGLAMGESPALNRALDPWLIVLLNLPALVIIVLAYVWGGLTESAAIAAVASQFAMGRGEFMRRTPFADASSH